MLRLLKSIFKLLPKEIFLVSFVFCSTCVFAEEITITTYYPSPYGSYNQLGTNKFAVDINGVAVPTEFAAMANGDAHIGRSLIIGAGGGSGFAYDEGATTADGTLLVKGNLGIGMTAPAQRLDVNGTIRATAYQVGATPGYNLPINVMNAAGVPCTITVTSGIITNSTC